MPPRRRPRGRGRAAPDRRRPEGELRRRGGVATIAAQEIAVRWLAEPGELESAFALREEVFYGEQGVPREEEFDGLDEQALHVIALSPEGETVIGTLRVLIDGPRAKVGRVAVQRDWRGRGIASRMLRLALAAARERGCEEVRLASQVHVVGLYERAGFTVESEQFQEAGIPHVWMGLRLAEDG